MKNNTGALAALISDPEGKKKLYGFLDNLSTAATPLLATVIAQLEKATARWRSCCATRSSQEFTGHLNSFQEPGLDRQEARQRTEPREKLINDPADLDAANHVVIGLDESWMLRWLIRDRQSGIKRNTTKAQRSSRTRTPAVAPEANPAPTPTPTPHS